MISYNYIGLPFTDIVPAFNPDKNRGKKCIYTRPDRPADKAADLFIYCNRDQYCQNSKNNGVHSQERHEYDPFIRLV